MKWKCYHRRKQAVRKDYKQLFCWFCWSFLHGGSESKSISNAQAILYAIKQVINGGWRWYLPRHLLVFVHEVTQFMNYDASSSSHLPPLQGVVFFPQGFHFLRHLFQLFLHLHKSSIQFCTTIVYCSHLWCILICLTLNSTYPAVGTT